MHDFSTVVRKVNSTIGKAYATVIGPVIRRSINRRLAVSLESYDFIVYFADSPDLLYQVKQWIAPLEKLTAAGSRVVFVVNNALSARALRPLSALPILLTRSMAEIERFVKAHDVQGVFYVNNSQANFTALRMTRPVHIHLNHGESEKSSMVSNQLKAYDYAFIAGDAAANRILANIRRIDPSHLVRIGRPQLGFELGEAVTGTDTITVLYAPTWEGDSKDMAYSSLNSIGFRLVKELIADDRFTLVFRPHPKTGTWSRDTAKSLQKIKDEINRSAKNRLPIAHRIDTTANPTVSIVSSDIVIADNSAMAMDAIGLDKPLLAVSPDSSEDLAQLYTDPFTLFGSVPTLGEDYRGNFADAILSVVNSPIQETQSNFRRHVFGDPALGTGTERFISASRMTIGK